MQRMFKTFSIVPIEYTIPQIYAIQRLNIVQSKQFIYSGLNFEYPVDRMIEFFKIVTSNTHEDCVIYTKLIYDMVELVANTKATNSCILILRLSLPSDEFKIPRFHYDGGFFSMKGNTIQEKFLLTIKGPGSLLCEPSPENKKKFDEIFFSNMSTQSELDVRTKLYSVIKDDNILQLTNNQGAFMKTHEFVNGIGNIFDTAIHSEPNITQSRLFISIVPGSADEINESIKAKWNTRI
jgi:hypothetical protein